MARIGTLPCVKAGRAVRFKPRDIEAYTRRTA